VQRPAGSFCFSVWISPCWERNPSLSIVEKSRYHSLTPYKRKARLSNRERALFCVCGLVVASVILWPSRTGTMQPYPDYPTLSNRRGIPTYKEIRELAPGVAPTNSVDRWPAARPVFSRLPVSTIDFRTASAALGFRN